jgi:hypothetical protein
MRLFGKIRLRFKSRETKVSGIRHHCHDTPSLIHIFQNVVKLPASSSVTSNVVGTPAVVPAMDDAIENTETTVMDTAINCDEKALADVGDAFHDPEVLDVKRRVRVFAIAARFLGAQFALVGARPEANNRAFQLSDFAILGVLGTGSFATVFRVKDKITEGIFALKVVMKAGMTENARASMLKELEALKRLVGVPGFLQLKASFHDSENYYLLTVSHIVFSRLCLR